VFRNPNLAAKWDGKHFKQTGDGSLTILMPRFCAIFDILGNKGAPQLAPNCATSCPATARGSHRFISLSQL